MASIESKFYDLSLVFLYTVSDDDSIYELVNDSQKQEGETKARTNHSFIDEHQSPPMAGTEPSEETLENNTDFEKTEDHLLYEEVAKV